MRALRTLSARILLGFAALAFAFGYNTVFFIRNMIVVEDDLHAIRNGYLPLIPRSKDLVRLEEDLKGYAEEGFALETNSYKASFTLRTTRERRTDAFVKLKASANVVALLPARDPFDLSLTPNLDRLQTSLDGLKPAYTDLFVALHKGEPLDGDTVTRPLHTIVDGERRIYRDVLELSNRLDFEVNNRMRDLEHHEGRIRFWTVLLGSIAMAVAVLISIWVVVTLRPLRRLRAAAGRVAAGDYANRIDEHGPAEVSELAREFNAMARAVDERERELVRSERLAAIGKLSAMITHEIRNPLSAIGLNAELLDDELEGNAEGRALCRAIHHEVDRLTAITEEYLAFGRLPKPKIASEHLSPMVDALASFVREDLAAKHVELALDLGDNDPIALVDASQLRQCLVNLVRNAAEATAAKGGGRVTLRTRKAGDRAVIEVEDTGIGIAPEVLPRLFDTFFSTKEGGSGLGLALTQQIVKDHGGDLAVESTVGRGTTFTVSIPRG
jgi:two-component system, NtrC family, sensor kinase